VCVDVLPMCFWCVVNLLLLWLCCGCVVWQRLSTHPDAKFFYRRGCLLSEKGDLDEAMADLTAASKMLPGDAAIASKLKAVKR
jgi:hypothetical protein